jgi:hypothetical protein
MTAINPHRLTVRQLQAELRKLGLSQQGKKVELIARQTTALR